VPVAGEKILVGAAHGAEQQLVLNRPAIDEEILPGGGAAVQGRQPGEAGEAVPFPFGGNRQRVGGEIPPEHCAESFEACGLPIARNSRQAHPCPLALGKSEGNRGMRHRQPFNHIDCVIQLGARRLEELQPRRRRIEKIAHLDSRPLAAARRRK
jgi:hypothetical protein